MSGRINKISAVSGSEWVTESPYNTWTWYPIIKRRGVGREIQRIRASSKVTKLLITHSRLCQCQSETESWPDPLVSYIAMVQSNWMPAKANVVSHNLHACMSLRLCVLHRRKVYQLSVSIANTIKDDEWRLIPHHHYPSSWFIHVRATIKMMRINKVSPFRMALITSTAVFNRKYHNQLHLLQQQFNHQPHHHLHHHHHPPPSHPFHSPPPPLPLPPQRNSLKHPPTSTHWYSHTFK